MRFLKYISAILLIILVTPHANAARLYFYPQNASIIEGDSHVVQVRIDTEGESINALEIGGTVTNGLIESINTANSLVQIFVGSSFVDNSFSFTGGTPGGFIGDGIIGVLTIRPTGEQNISIEFDENPNLLSGLGQSLSSQISVLSAAANVTTRNEDYIDISSKSHPDENSWYNETNLHLRWGLEDGVEYSYLVSLDPAATPDDIPDRPSGQLEWQGDISIEGIDQGIYYFTLKRVGQDDIFRYRAMVDTAPPNWIAVESSVGVAETGGLPFVSFVAKDDLSGISHYEVRVDKGLPNTVFAPYVLPEHYGRITITAYDNAGNTVEETIISDTERRAFGIYIVVLLIVIGGAVVAIKPIRERVFMEKIEENG